ncbi:MAG: hypothetical protein ACC647_01825 [Anaerolineales bacterium]
MATNSERPRRFDLRTTIPLATETLVSLARQPKRSWIIPTLTLITGIAFGVLMLELLVFPGPVTALAFEGELRSRLSANYGADPVVAKLHELRLTIVEDVLGMDEGDGSGPPAIAMLLQDPVPSATPKATNTQPVAASPTSAPSDPSATSALTDAAVLTATSTPLSAPSKTPVPTTVAAAASEYCDALSITGMWVNSGDEVRARVKNSGSYHAYLTGTLFEWPDVPGSTYVDWFRFDNRKYFSSDDWSSPTSSSGSRVRIKRGKTETWRVDFDDEPDEGIYGSFAVTLRFDVSGKATCDLNASTFKDIPAMPVPTPEPTDPPAPTDTPEPIPTETAAPTNTPGVAATASETAIPTETPTSVPPTTEPPTLTHEG